MDGLDDAAFSLAGISCCADSGKAIAARKASVHKDARMGVDTVPMRLRLEHHGSIGPILSVTVAVCDGAVEKTVDRFALRLTKPGGANKAVRIAMNGRFGSLWGGNGERNA